MHNTNAIMVRFALAFRGFCPPSNSNSSLVFGVGNSSSDPVSFVQPRVDAVPLFTWIKIKDHEACGDKIEVVDIVFLTAMSMMERTPPSGPGLAHQMFCDARVSLIAFASLF